MQVSVCHSLSEVGEADWNALGAGDYPFTRHAFLYGLEQFECLQPFGWHPVYFLIHQADVLIAALPCYIKTNSYGELVFDHAWAQAYQRSGLEYYPKLVTAIPYTPATGDRFLLRQTSDLDDSAAQECRLLLCSAATTFCREHKLSSWHILFAEKSILQQFQQQQIMLRSDIQFHWQNQDYADFDGFLTSLSSRKRKNIRKERQSAQQHGFQICIQAGDSLSEKEWRRVHELYAGIYYRKHGTATLSADFFVHLGKCLKGQVLVVVARDDEHIVAASLLFRSDSHLYGRVWGCEQFANHLHFECCYYQGIDYCIANRLQWFDPGAQGEHKLSRGFLPRNTWSGHWIADSEFRTAIANFLDQEQRHIDAYAAQLSLHSPYKSA